MEKFLNDLRAIEDNRKDALKELETLRDNLDSVIVKLGGVSRKASRGSYQKKGNGVSKAELQVYVSEINKIDPGISQSELEAKVTTKAKQDGKSTKGLISRLRSVLEEREAVSSQST